MQRGNLSDPAALFAAYFTAARICAALRLHFAPAHYTFFFNLILISIERNSHTPMLALLKVAERLYNFTIAAAGGRGIGFRKSASRSRKADFTIGSHERQKSALRS